MSRTVGSVRLCGMSRASGPGMQDTDETVARITAERLVEHLERSGYVVMHKPPLGQHEAPGNLAGWIEKATKPDHGESVSASIRTRIVRDNGPRPSSTCDDLG
jgi:hypothetical protein